MIVMDATDILLAYGSGKSLLISRRAMVVACDIFMHDGLSVLAFYRVWHCR